MSVYIHMIQIQIDMFYYVCLYLSMFTSIFFFLSFFQLLSRSSCLQCHRLQPIRLLCPWNSPGKNTGVGSHSFLQEVFLTQGSNLGLPNCKQILYHLNHQGSPNINMCAYLYAESLQSCPTLCKPTVHSLPGSSVHGVLQARIVEWVAMASSRGYS